MPRLLTWLLLPFSWLYAGVMAVRNWLYDIGWKKSQTYAVPLIDVGNLRVGGTGKTPHVSWLLEELLRQGQRPAVLSRGYGRCTKGPRLATSADSASTVGDEPWQYFQQFTGQQVPVAVAEKRSLGVELLLKQHPALTVIVLDDAYQHRAVRTSLNILLTELARPFYEDFVLPAGRLRESRRGAARADIVIVTKCPLELSLTEQAEVVAHIRRFSRTEVPILFSAYTYDLPRPLFPNLVALLPPKPQTPALLLTGIAQPAPLQQHLESQGYQIVCHANFPDHHAFQTTDITAVRQHWQAGWPIFTTAKDATRLLAPELRDALLGLPLYIISIGVTFLGTDASVLQQLLAESVSESLDR